MAKEKDNNLRPQLDEYFDIFKKVDVLFVVENGFQVFVSEDKAKEYAEKHKEKYIAVNR